MPLMATHHEIVITLRMSHMTLLKALEVSLQAVQFRMGSIGYECEDCICRSVSVQGSVSQYVPRASCQTFPLSREGRAQCAMTSMVT